MRFSIDMEPMKISFGFSKSTKKPNLFAPNSSSDKKVELIECLEGQSIKIKDAVEEVKLPLIIPMKDKNRTLLDRVKAAKNQKKDLDDTRPDSELTQDELAARQLIREAQQRLANGSTSTSVPRVSILPLKPDEVPLEGEKESLIEDYESVPISDYGLALLRGMGWTEGQAIGKKSSKIGQVKMPELRPKGLGLGASKMLKSEVPKKALDEDLGLKKNGFAKVVCGARKGIYCEVQGFDEESGRIIVKLHPKGDIVNMNEFMLAPVPRDEFLKGSKVLNNAKFEEYREISESKLKTQANSASKKHKNSSSEDDRHTKPRNKSKRHKHARRESSSSDVEAKKDKRKKTKCKSRHRRSRSGSKEPKRYKNKR